MFIAPPEVKESGMSAQVDDNAVMTFSIILGICLIAFVLGSLILKDDEESLERFNIDTKEFKDIIKNFRKAKK